MRRSPAVRGPSTAVMTIREIPTHAGVARGAAPCWSASARWRCSPHGWPTRAPVLGASWCWRVPRGSARRACSTRRAASPASSGCGRSTRAAASWSATSASGWCASCWSPPSRAWRGRAGGAAGRAAGLAEAVLGPPTQAAPAGDPHAALHGLYWLLHNLSEQAPLLVAVNDLQWVERAVAPLPPPPGAAPGRAAGGGGLLAGAPGRRASSRSCWRGSCWRRRCCDRGRCRAAPSPRSCGRGSAAGRRRTSATRATRAPRGTPSCSVSCCPSSTATTARRTRSTLRRCGRSGRPASRRPCCCGWGGSDPGGRPSRAPPPCSARPPRCRRRGRWPGWNRARRPGSPTRSPSLGVLVPGRPLRFAHPVVRSAIHQDIATGERAALHRRAAELLAATPSSRPSTCWPPSRPATRRPSPRSPRPPARRWRAAPPRAPWPTCAARWPAAAAVRRAALVGDLALTANLLGQDDAYALLEEASSWPRASPPGARSAPSWGTACSTPSSRGTAASRCSSARWRASRTRACAP